MTIPYVKATHQLLYLICDDHSHIHLWYSQWSLEIPQMRPPNKSMFSSSSTFTNFEGWHTHSHVLLCNLLHPAIVAHQVLQLAACTMVILEMLAQNGGSNNASMLWWVADLSLLVHADYKPGSKIGLYAIRRHTRKRWWRTVHNLYIPIPHPWVDFMSKHGTKGRQLWILQLCRILLSTSHLVSRSGDQQRSSILHHCEMGWIRYTIIITFNLPRW